MDSSLREYKLKAIAQLIENIRLLTKKYPSRDELIATKCTFFEIDISGFNKLVYYLSNLEYMTKTNEMFVNWPPTDDSEKCLKIIKHVMKLNTIYEDANIPIPSVEKLFSPEGLEIVIFFLKWSELCMLEHLKTLPNIFPQILHRIKPNKDPAQTEVMLKVMQEQVAGINIEIRSMINKYNEKMEIKENELNITESNRAEFLFDYSTTLFKEIFLTTQIHFQYISDELKTEQFPVGKLIQYSQEFQSYSEIFDEIEKFVKSAHTINWYQYFNGLRKFLESRIEDLPNPSPIYLEETSEKAKHIILIYLNLKERLQNKIDALKSELEKINKEKISALTDRFDLLVTPFVE